MTFTEIDTRPANAKIKRDQWGRPVLPHPETGKEQGWIRPTTIAGSLANRFGLEVWDQYNIVWGIGQRQELFLRAAASKRDDKDTLAEIVDVAKTVAGSKSSATLGSAVHQFAERIDLGEEMEIPEPAASDVAAYRAAMERHGIEIVPGWAERLVCIADLGIAGTPDRLVRTTSLAWCHPEDINLEPLPRIGDLKTGDGAITYGQAEIPLQFAIYANATHWWTGEGWEPMPEIDRTKAIMMHLPAGTGECDLYEVDIVAGWEAVQLALDVRAWRNRKDLCVRLDSAPVAAADGEVEQAAPARQPAPSPSTNGQPDRASTRSNGAAKGDEGVVLSPGDSPAPDPARLAWLRDRVDAIKTSSATGDLTPKQRLAGLWSLRPEIPTFPKGGPRTDAEVTAVAGMCDLVEMEFEIAFGASDPTLPKPTKANRKKGSGNA